MGLEIVVNEILSQGGREEQQILQNAEREKQKILDAAEGEADALRAKILAETRARIDALRREQLSAAEFEARRRLLTTQRELSDEFRTKLLERLSALPKAEREKIHANLLKRAQKELSDGKVHARKDDLTFLSKGTGYISGSELATAGGFQIESSDGTLLLDYRFETLLENAWKEIQAQVRPLFQG